MVVMQNSISREERLHLFPVPERKSDMDSLSRKLRPGLCLSIIALVFECKLFMSNLDLFLVASPSRQQHCTDKDPEGISLGKPNFSSNSRLDMETYSRLFLLCF